MAGVGGQVLRATGATATSALAGLGARGCIFLQFLADRRALQITGVTAYRRVRRASLRDFAVSTLLIGVCAGRARVVRRARRVQRRDTNRRCRVEQRASSRLLRALRGRLVRWREHRISEVYYFWLRVAPY